jgi:vitamin B12 transport system substrate-binding protein
MVEIWCRTWHVAKHTFRALAALLLLARRGFRRAARDYPLPANTELAFAAGITPVGVSSYSDYPRRPQASNRLPAGKG